MPILAACHLIYVFSVVLHCISVHVVANKVLSLLLLLRFLLFEQNRQVRHAERSCRCERPRSIVIDNHDIRERSLCRWMYESDYDENRRPACIHRVYGCRNMLPNRDTNQCEMIKIRYPIQRRSGSFWLDDEMELPVACTKAIPHLHRERFSSNVRVQVP